MFAGCENLKCDFARGNKMGMAEGAFSGCGSLANVVLPDGLSWIAKKAFQNVQD